MQLKGEIEQMRPANPIEPGALFYRIERLLLSKNGEDKCLGSIFIVLYIIACLTIIFLVIDVTIYHREITRYKREKGKLASENKLLDDVLGTKPADSRRVRADISEFASRWGLKDTCLDHPILTKVPIRTMVDIGCGKGLAIKHALGKMTQIEKIQGFDVSSGAIDLAKGAFPGEEARVELKVADIENLQTFGAKGGVDLVVCTDVLQYLSPLQMLKALNKISRCVSKNGFFIGSLLVSKNFYPIDYCTLYTSFYPANYIREILALFGFSMIEVMQESEWLKSGRACKYSFIAQKTSPVSSVVKPLSLELYSH